MERTGYPEVRVPHINVFAHLGRGEGMRMSDLAEQMQLTPGAATQLITHLEGLGLVERLPDPRDGRGVIVRPTPAANEGFEAARARLGELEAECERRVGPRRWRTFTQVISEMAELLEREKRSSPPRM
jgi:DNA-binding MarR family transcriptional regulator